MTRRASVHLQRLQTLAAELQRQRLQQADGGDAASGAGAPGGAAEQAALSHEQREAGQGAAHEGAEPFGTEAELGEPQTSGGEEQHAAGGEGEGRSAAGSEAPQAPDPAHLSGSHAAAWAAHHITANSTSNGAAGSPRPGHARPTPQEPTPPGAAEEDGWQLVSDQAAAWKLQGGALLARAAEHPSYSRDREGFRNILMTAMMSIPWCGARKGGAVWALGYGRAALCLWQRHRGWPSRSGPDLWHAYGRATTTACRCPAATSVAPLACRAGRCQATTPPSAATRRCCRSGVRRWHGPIWW